MLRRACNKQRTESLKIVATRSDKRYYWLLCKPNRIEKDHARCQSKHFLELMLEDQRTFVGDVSGIPKKMQRWSFLYGPAPNSWKGYIKQKSGLKRNCCRLVFRRCCRAMRKDLWGSPCQVLRKLMALKELHLFEPSWERSPRGGREQLVEPRRWEQNLKSHWHIIIILSP